MATYRGYAREELRRALGNMAWAIQHIAQLEPVYRDQHPDIADVILQICDGLDMVATVIQTLHDQL